MRQAIASHLPAAAALLTVALLLPRISPAQQYNGVPNVNMQAPVVQVDSSINPSDNQMLQAQRMRALNKMRQKSLIRDTDKLLKLAQELNAGSAPGGSRMTGPERMKTLAQIEKLAKRVREQMSYANSGSPSLLSPFSVATP